MSSEAQPPRLTARLRLASPDDILRWSAGEVTKPDTLHPRSGKPVPGGLFCEDIFGPLHEWRCRCGKLSRRAAAAPHLPRLPHARAAAAAADAGSMGHVELAAPVAHIWFVKARPSPDRPAARPSPHRRRAHRPAARRT